MHRLPSRFATGIALFCLAMQSSHAAKCEEVELTAAQDSFLAEKNITINKPAGDVQVIQRCDTNEDNWVDITDIRAIALMRNRPVAHPDDPMDWDRNGVVNLLDVRGCQLACALARCKPMPAGMPPPDEIVGGVTEDAECVQVEDTDNDGEVDQLIAISEIPLTDTRSDAVPNLELIIVQEFEGELKVYKEPFAGKGTEEKVDLHLSKQPAGVVDLSPGTVEIDKPATVAYRNGDPRVLYFWVDGELFRAPYHVDD